ncbi:MAG: hypothetical protein NTU53_13245 [Planctomycetota bacterium]|nr:hypothetical protein [Planctomycetota bacterium]
MEIWIRVLVLQAGIFAFSTLVGVLLFRLPLLSSMLAAVLISPAPLFQVSPGAAGFIYAGDLLVIVLLIQRFLGGSASVGPQARLLRLLAFLTVVLLPALSTVLGYLVDSENRLYKPICLGIFRAIGYYITFSAFIRRAGHNSRADSELAVQCIAFWLIACCGLAQFATGIDLDLWTTIRHLGLSKTSGGYGRGFMGMYRGAVGAFGVGILAVLPVVFAGRRFASIVLPGIAAMILATTLAVGSRQGVMIGIMVFFLGLGMGVRARPPGYRLRAFVQGSAGLVILGSIGLIGWAAYAPYEFQKFVGRRFATLTDPDKVVEVVQKRDPRFPHAFDNVTSSPYVFLLGTGYGLEYGQTVGGRGALSVIYVDSEIMYVWQLGGTLLLAGYLVFLIRMRLRLRERCWPPEDSARAAIGAAIVVLYGGLMLMYGHFFIMTTSSHEAPIAYWTWAVFGTAVGLCSRRPVDDANAEMLQPAWDSAGAPDGTRG